MPLPICGGASGDAEWGEEEKKPKEACEGSC